MHTANIQVRSVVAWAARSPHVPERDRAGTVAVARSLLATDRSWLRDRGFVGTAGRVPLPRSAHLGSGEAGA